MKGKVGLMYLFTASLLVCVLVFAVLRSVSFAEEQPKRFDFDKFYEGKSLADNPVTSS